MTPAKEVPEGWRRTPKATLEFGLSCVGSDEPLNRRQRYHQMAEMIKLDLGADRSPK